MAELRYHPRSLVCERVTLLEFEAFYFLGLEFRPDRELMEDYRACDGHIEGGNLVCILLNIHEVVADRYLVFVQAGALIAQDEKSRATEGMLMYGPCLLHYFDSTYANSLLSAVSSYLFKDIKVSVLGLQVCPLRPERPQLLLPCARSPVHYEHLRNIECGGRPDQVPEVLLLLHIKHQHVCLGALRVMQAHSFGLLIFHRLGGENRLLMPFNFLLLLLSR